MSIESSRSAKPKRRVAGNQGPRFFDKQVIEFGSGLAADFQNVLKARRRDQRDAPALPLSNAFVPTVVPQASSSADPSLTPVTYLRQAHCEMASAGLCGVEGIFRISILPPRRYTQSVNVPPVSKAMRMKAAIVAQKLTVESRESRVKS